MKYGLEPRFYPVISIHELKEAVKMATDEEIEDLRNLLFYADYMNDCYKSVYFTDDALIWYDEKPDFYTDEEWQEELENLRQTNIVYGVLREIFGDKYDTVLIDVTW